MKNSYFTKTLSDLANKIIGSLDWDSKEIYPSKENVFNVLDDLNRYKTKVVIIGQDPFYTPNMATGRAFDVPINTSKLPPSLHNILKKISKQYTNNKKSILEHLPEQGVVLLNTALTVEKNMPNSHKSLWAPFTVELIKIINERNNGLVFLLWGNNALKYIPYIDYNKHVVIGSSHPSPLSNSKNCGTFPPFNDINCFELTNITLETLKEKPILW